MCVCVCVSESDNKERTKRIESDDKERTPKRTVQIERAEQHEPQNETPKDTETRKPAGRVAFQEVNSNEVIFCKGTPHLKLGIQCSREQLSMVCAAAGALMHSGVCAPCTHE